MRVPLLRMCGKELKNIFFCRKYTCDSGALNGFNPGTGDLGLISGLGRSPGEGKGYPLQYSGLENPMDCRTHGVAKSGDDSDMTEQLSL